ncbi:hypothetical protein KEM56_000404 [Ascosphaera pollenicola]|nr:hypothetical protein KEM56_000404 [Ascosphaera pollenicola]
MERPAAVSSILYETPVASTKPPKRHILNCLVQNEPGVLSRVSGILAARGFNIDSLVVCNTEVDDLSRMTIVLSGQDGVVEQARRQLEDLVPVWAVLDYTGSALVQRELLLAKVSLLGPEVFEELLQHHREITSQEPVASSSSSGGGEESAAAEGTADADADAETAQSKKEAAAREEMAKMQFVQQHAKDFHPSRLAASEALRHKHEHLDAITHLTHQFGGKVLDISTNNCVVEVYVLKSSLSPYPMFGSFANIDSFYSSAKQSRIDSFLKLIAPFGILESTRTGLMALPRSPFEDTIEQEEKEASDIVDASTLPPG